MTLRYSLLTSTDPKRLTKRFDLDATGELQVSPAGNMVSGYVQHASARDLHKLAQQLDALAPNQAPVWGLSIRNDAPIVTKGKLGDDNNALARRREDFAFAEAPGVMMLDHDAVRPGSPPLSSGDLLDHLWTACPALRDAPTLVRPSASAGIAGPGGPLKPLTRWRVYIAVANAAEIPEAGRRLVTRLWAAGGAWFAVGKAGQVLERAILDASVWQPERLDFAAAAILGPELTRVDCPARVLNGDAPLFDLQRIAVDDVTIDAAANRVRERAHVEPERHRVREDHLSTEAPRLAERRGISLKQARMSLDAAGDGVLMGPHSLYLHDGREVTVEQLRANPNEFDGVEMHDPLEPEYSNEDSRISIAYLSQGEPIIFSHAHGGYTLRLLPDPATIGFGRDPLVPRGCMPIPPAQLATLTQQSAAVPPPPATDWADSFRSWTPSGDLIRRRVVVDWAVEDWVQAGHVGALVAAGGTGKTTLLLVLGVCIALCRPFFGHRVQQGSFALLSNDDTQDDLDGVLTRVAQAMDLTSAEAYVVEQKVRVFSMRGLPGCKTFTRTERGDVVPTGLEDQVLRAVAGMDDLVGVACDTLRQFSGGSSNDEQVITLTLDAAARVAAQTGAFVVFPHHTGKQNFRDGVTDMYAGSGSAALADNSRFLLLLQAPSWNDLGGKVVPPTGPRGSPLFLKSTRGSALVKAPPPMYLHRCGYLIERLVDRKALPGEIADPRELAVLKAIYGGNTTKTAIYRSIGGRKESVFVAVDRVVAAGYVAGGDVVQGSTRPMPLYLTDAGRALLASVQGVPERGSPLDMGTTGTTQHD